MITTLDCQTKRATQLELLWGSQFLGVSGHPRPLRMLGPRGHPGAKCSHHWERNSEKAGQIWPLASLSILWQRGWWQISRNCKRLKCTRSPSVLQQPIPMPATPRQLPSEASNLTCQELWTPRTLDGRWVNEHGLYGTISKLCLNTTPECK